MPFRDRSARNLDDFRFRPAVHFPLGIVRVLVALECQHSLKATFGVDLGYVGHSRKADLSSIGDLHIRIPLPMVLIQQEEQSPPVDDGVGDFPVLEHLLDCGDLIPS